MKQSLDKNILPKEPFMKKYDPAGEGIVEIGAVYYRRSAPPEQDWERDYQVAKEDGHTMFRHWFTWNSVHVAPDAFDWAPFDRHLDLAAKYGIKTIIAEHIYEAPDWLYRICPEGRTESASGSAHTYCMGDSAATGITRMCLDNPTVQKQARRFLSELAKHYKGHPGLYGYDIWNECSMYSPDNLCYCPDTQKAFREWVKKKYNNDLVSVRNTWKRYSLSCWEDIELPRQIQPYPDTMDMLRFRLDNALEHMKMRYDVIREADPDVMISAHGNAKTFCDLPACGDDYRSAEYCDVYGYTYWYGNKCSPVLAGDMMRIAANGKEYWRAEGIGNHDWQTRGGNLPMMEKEEMRRPENIRLDALISFATGARGYLNPRWRALQDGGLFDAFGWYNLNGSRSERSAEIKTLADWANAAKMKKMWRALPVRGQAGVLLLPDAQLYCHAMYQSTDFYSLSYQGAYEAFQDSGIQADPILLRHMDDYKLVYVPFPAALSYKEIEILTKWVAAGGFLVTEGCLGYFDEMIHAYEQQPSRGLAMLCGAVQANASFGPDMWHGLTINSENGKLAGGVYRQSYSVTTGRAIAWYDNGETAGVENSFGEGKIRVYGSMLGYGYKKKKKAEYLHTFKSFLPFSGQTRAIRTDYNTGIITRLCADHKGEDIFLWCINAGDYPQKAVLEINPGYFQPEEANAWHNGHDILLEQGVIQVTVPAKDAAIIQLK